MPIPLLLTLGLHMAGAVFWLFSAVILGWNGNPGASKTMFRPQMIAAAVVIFTGGGLWHLLHAGGFGPREMMLAAGAVLAIVAAGVQGGMVGGPVRRLAGATPEGAVASRIVLGQRIAAGLLAVVLLLMIGERFV
jgi:hypothetical protein